MTRRGPKRGPLPGWQDRIRWWMTHGAGYGTPHVPHQWSHGQRCAKCGELAGALALHVRMAPQPDGSIRRWRVPPACAEHEREVVACAESYIAVDDRPAR